MNNGMTEPLKLHPHNIAGCNGIKIDGASTVGRFVLDLADGTHIVLEFPNQGAVVLAIKRLEELRERWLREVTVTS